MKLTQCLIICCILFFSCDEDRAKERERNSPNQKTKIVKKDSTVNVLIQNGPYSYSNFRDSEFGLEYDILEAFAKQCKMNLNYKFFSSDNEKDSILKTHNINMIASNLPCNFEESKILFSRHYLKSKIVLVRQKTDSKFNIDSMENKIISVPKNSLYSKFLFNLKNRTGISLQIKEIDNVSIYDLIEEVEKGNLDYTICHDNIGRLKDFITEKIDLSTVLSLDQRIAYAILNKDEELKRNLDQFLITFINSEEYIELKRKYFNSSFLKPPVAFVKDTANLTPFDQIFMNAAKESNWDWKLIAALAQKESNFNAQAIGNGGSFGVMQLMPFIGEKYGVDINSSIEKQIKTGVIILDGLLDKWKKIPDLTQRSKFALASYNAGIGHVIDARNLAIELDLNPLKWDGNVEKALMMLNDPTYYRKINIKCGPYYGHADYYVRRIFEIYIDYLAIKEFEK